MQRETTMERRMLADVHRSDVQKKEIFAFGTAGRGALCVFIFFRPLVVSRCFFFLFC